MQDLFKAYENLPLPDPIKAVGTVIFLGLITLVGLAFSLVFWQFFLNLVHPPAAKKFKVAVDSCFPKDDL